MSYRGNVGDTRYSPVEYLYNFLKRDKFNIILHDPYVKYWEEKELYLDQSLSQVLKNNINILVFSTAHDDYKNSDTLINKLKE